jgi:hypothetical protein
MAYRVNERENEVMNQKARVLRERRTSLRGPLEYQDGTAWLPARWRDVSRTGAAIQTARCLRPGRKLGVRFVSPLDAVTPVTLVARVAWCAPAVDGPGFVSGVAVYRDVPDTALAFAAVGYRAQRREAAAQFDEEATDDAMSLPRAV